jgi:hypothetical protein
MHGYRERMINEVCEDLLGVQVKVRNAVCRRVECDPFNDAATAIYNNVGRAQPVLSLVINDLLRDDDSWSVRW